MAQAVQKVDREILTLGDIDNISRELGKLAASVDNLDGHIRDVKDSVKGLYGEIKNVNDRIAINTNKTDRAHERIDEVNKKIESIDLHIETVKTTAESTQDTVERWKWVLGGIAGIGTIFANAIFDFIKSLIQ